MEMLVYLTLNSTNKKRWIWWPTAKEEGVLVEIRRVRVEVVDEVRESGQRYVMLES